MRAGRVIQVVAGAILGLLGVVAMLVGGALGLLQLRDRDDDGYFAGAANDLRTETRALTSEEVDLGADHGRDWTPFDGTLATVRLRVTDADGGPVFVGIGPSAAVERYLDGVAHAVVVDESFDDVTARFRTVAGDVEPASPAAQALWVASTEGQGEQELTWDVERGRWTVVVMHPTGQAGVDVRVDVDVRVGWLQPVAMGLLIAGIALAIGGGWAMASALRQEPTTSLLVAAGGYPLRLRGRLDEPLNRGLWLVKWLLALPHLVVLAALWIAFVVTTAAAFVAILVTGRYPRPLFDFGVGVLRWTWRVGYYGFSAIGTDRYPPFSLAPDPDYPADLEIDRPERLSRGLVLMKSWLLALPHLLVVGILAGGIGLHAGGVVTALVVVAGIVLLATGLYPVSLFDVVMGCNRWTYRVLAYVALMTDEYPPFRFDPGGDEPVPSAPEPEPPAPTSADAELVGSGW